MDPTSWLGYVMGDLIPHTSYPHNINRGKCSNIQTSTTSSSTQTYPVKLPTQSSNAQIPTSDIMPRGGEYDNGPTVASDNAIDAGENKIAGAPQGDSDVSLTTKI